MSAPSQTQPSVPLRVVVPLIHSTSASLALNRDLQKSTLPPPSSISPSPSSTLLPPSHLNKENLIAAEGDFRTLRRLYEESQLEVESLRSRVKLMELERTPSGPPPSVPSVFAESHSVLLQGEVDKKERIIDSLTKELTALKDSVGGDTLLRITNVDKENRRLRHKVNTLRASQQAAQHEAADWKGRFESVAQSKANDGDAKERLINDLKSKAEMNSQRVAELTAESNRLKKAEGTLHTESVRMSAELSEAKVHIGQLELENRAIAPLRAEVSTLRTAKNTAESLNSELRYEVDDLRAKLSTATSNLNAATSQMSNYSSKFDSNETKMADAENRNRLLEKKIEYVEGEVEEKNEEIKGLMREMARWREFESATRDRARTEALKDIQVEEAKKEIQRLQQEVSNGRSKLHSLQKEIDIAASQVVSLKFERDAALDETSRLSEIIQRESKQIQSSESETSAAEHRLSSLRSDLQKSEILTSKYKFQVDRISSEYESLKTKLADMESHNEKLLAEITELRIHEESQRFEMKILSDEREENVKWREEMEGEIRRKDEHIVEANSKLHDAQLRSAQLERKVAEEHRHVENLHMKVSDERKVSSDIHEGVTQMKSTIASLNAQIDSLRKESSEWKSECDAVRRRLRSFESTSNSEIAKSTDVSLALTHSQQQNAALKALLTDFNSKMAELKDELATESHRRADEVRLREAAEHRYSESESKVNTMGEEIHSLRVHLEEAESKYRHVVSQCNRMVEILKVREEEVRASAEEKGNVEGEVVRLREEILRLRSVLSEKDNSLSSLQNSLSVAESRCHQLEGKFELNRHELLGYDEDVKSLLNENSLLTREVEKMRLEVADLKSTNAAQMGVIGDLENRMQYSMRDTEEVVQRHRMLGIDNEKLKSALSECEKESQQWRTEWQKVEELIRFHEGKMAAQQREIRHLADSLSVKTGECDRLKDDIVVAHRQVDFVRSNLNEHKDEILRLQKLNDTLNTSLDEFIRREKNLAVELQTAIMKVKQSEGEQQKCVDQISNWRHRCDALEKLLEATRVEAASESAESKRRAEEAAKTMADAQMEKMKARSAMSSQPSPSPSTSSSSLSSSLSQAEPADSMKREIQSLRNIILKYEREMQKIERERESRRG